MILTILDAIDMIYTRKAKDFAAARTVKIVKRKRTPDEISRETEPVSFLITTFRCLSITAYVLQSPPSSSR